LEFCAFIFKDRDAAKANEAFPANDRAVVLDALGYYEELSQTDPERILRICDWMRLEVAPQAISLERLRALLLDCAQRLGTAP